MDKIDHLTNEEISKKFGNQFDLVNYAIHLATNMIETGREPRVRMSTENPALLVLEEISEGKDTFVEEVKKSSPPIVEKTEMALEESSIGDEDEDEDEEDDESFDEEEEAQEVLSD